MEAKPTRPKRDRSAYWRARSAKRRQEPGYQEAQSAIYKAWHEKHSKDPDRLARKAEQMRSYSQMHREKHVARRLLRTAIEAGRVVRQPCAVCGEERVEGHHVAYDMPLDVVWLCRLHHRELHAKATQ